MTKKIDYKELTEEVSEDINKILVKLDKLPKWGSKSIFHDLNHLSLYAFKEHCECFLENIKENNEEEEYISSDYYNSGCTDY